VPRVNSSLHARFDLSSALSSCRVSSRVNSNHVTCQDRCISVECGVTSVSRLSVSLKSCVCSLVSCQCGVSVVSVWCQCVVVHLS